MREGLRLGVDYSLTVSCYQADSAGRACGRCDSCRIRRDGFDTAGVVRPHEVCVDCAPWFWGSVAQLVEQRPFKALVVGSSPTRPKSIPLKSFKNAHIRPADFGYLPTETCKSVHGRAISRRREAARAQWQTPDVERRFSKSGGATSPLPIGPRTSSSNRYQARPPCGSGRLVRWPPAGRAFFFPVPHPAVRGNLTPHPTPPTVNARRCSS